MACILLGLLANKGDDRLYPYQRLEFRLLAVNCGIGLNGLLIIHNRGWFDTSFAFTFFLLPIVFQTFSCICVYIPAYWILTNPVLSSRGSYVVAPFESSISSRTSTTHFTCRQMMIVPRGPKLRAELTLEEVVKLEEYAGDLESLAEKLISEWSIQNLMALQAIFKFESHEHARRSNRVLNKMAFDIYSRFIRVGSKREVHSSCTLLAYAPRSILFNLNLENYVVMEHQNNIVMISQCRTLWLLVVV